MATPVRLTQARRTDGQQALALAVEGAKWYPSPLGSNGMLEEVQEVFRSVFDDDSLVISRATTANDVAGWDSLMHVTLLVSLEQRFGIRFKSSEIADLKDVGELIDLIDLHRSRK